VFLDSLGNPNTVRNYGIGKTAERLGESRPLASIANDEILGVNMEDLDFAGRRCQVKAKGARTKARRRGQTREDYVLETVYWDAGAARLLPRLLKGRTRGPVFVTHRRPSPARSSARATCARTPALPGSRMGRPALCLISTPPYADRARAGTCTSTATPPCPPRRGRGKPAAAGGEVSAQEARERPPLLQALAGGDRRDHQPAGAQ
jgi:hypothetical protein